MKDIRRILTLSVLSFDLLLLLCFISNLLNEISDWYQRYSGIRDFINQYVKREDTILNVGCGNSRLTEDMFEDGTAFTSFFNMRTTISNP